LWVLMRDPLLRISSSVMEEGWMPSVLKDGSALEEVWVPSVLEDGSVLRAPPKKLR
jgi:hypothetical protein